MLLCNNTYTHTHKRGLSHTRVSVFLNKNSENDSLVFFPIKKSGEAFSMFRLYQKMIDVWLKLCDVW